MRMLRAAIGAAVLFVVMTAVAFAQEVSEAIIPIVDLLPEEVAIFGVAGGAIVTMLISILKGVGVIQSGDKKRIMMWNFGLSLVVTTLAALTTGTGETIVTALVSSGVALLSAIGWHETVGHALLRLVGKERSTRS